MKKVKEFEESIRVLAVGEYLSGGTTYRRVARKYGVPRTTIYRWVESGSGRDKAARDKGREAEVDESAEMRRLREDLEKARLENKLLNAMIEIAEEQLGVNIRKKRGAKR
jgi:transposase-like protein